MHGEAPREMPVGEKVVLIGRQGNEEITDGRMGGTIGHDPI